MKHAPPLVQLDDDEVGQTAQTAECYPKPTLAIRCHRLLAQAQEQVFLCNGSLIPSTPAELQLFRRSLHDVLTRGVRLSLLDDLEYWDVGDRRRLLLELRQRGADVRISPSAPHGMLIIDKLVAVACNNPVSDGEACTPIRSKPVIASLQRLAVITWRTAWDLELVSMLERRDSELSLAVLKLLNAGYKDEVAARRLGISLRTYRRHVADLIEILRARTRFEAGARAASLGLV
jgi:DNA-binding CsgD family transcriptional regulator